MPWQQREKSYRCRHKRLARVESGHTFRGYNSALRAEITGLRSEVTAEISSVRGDARADFRTLIAVVVAMWVATVLTVIGNLPIHL